MKLNKKKLKNFIYKSLKVVFPPNCVICDREGNLICKSCVRLLVRHDLECHVCHRKYTEEYFKENKSLVCDECKKSTSLDGVLIGYKYDKNIKKIIEYCKYSGYYYILEKVTRLLRPLVSLIKETLFKSETILIPVPMFFLKENIRGFNQSEKLCGYIKDQYRFEYLKLLIKTRPTRRQVGKSIEERLVSQKGVYKIDLKKIQLVENVKNIVIVDDVMTTGSTLEECGRVIKTRFPDINIYGLVIARGEM